MAESDGAVGSVLRFRTDSDGGFKESGVSAVILLGGAGTRLWPLSRKTYPKQFLPWVGTDSMLQATWRDEWHARGDPAGASEPQYGAGDCGGRSAGDARWRRSAAAAAGCCRRIT